MAYMGRQGIETQILSVPWSVTGTGEDPDFDTKFCRRVYEDYAAIIPFHPGRFGAFAAMPADDPKRALAEIRYALDELQVDGVLLSANAMGHYFGSPFYEPILAKLAEWGVPAFVHPRNSPCIEELVFGRPGSVVEFTFDTARNIHQRHLHRGLPTPSVADLDPRA